MAAFQPAAEGFDEQYAGVHLAAHNVDVVALVGECGGLGGDDLEVGVDAADVAVVEDLLGGLSGFGGLALVLGLVLQDAQGRRGLSSTCWKAERVVWR